MESVPYFRLILAEFPEVTGLPQASSLKPRDVFHHIVTNGSPVFECARRLAPEKLKVAKDEFKLLIETRVVNPQADLGQVLFTWPKRRTVHGEFVAITGV